MKSKWPSFFLLLWIGVLITLPAAAQDKRISAPFGANDSLDEVRDKISANGFGFTVGHNWVFDMSPEEKKAFYSRHAPLVPAIFQADPGMGPLALVKPASLPSSFDWRSQGGHSYIGPIRNQGSCGSCYAFGAAAAAEGTYNKATGRYDGNVVDFSESFIAWCLGTYGPYSYYFDGCNGADYSYSELEALTVEGITYESYFPYSVYDPGSCTHWSDPVVTFDSWYRVPCNDIDAIKTAIMTYGVVDAAVMVDSAFEGYSSGIYENTNTQCSGNPCSYTTTNHAISLVGWNDNGDAENNGYWILRNSWGTSWGESGYMRIKYRSAAVGCSVAYLMYACSSTTLTPTIQAPQSGFSLPPGTAQQVGVSLADQCGTTITGAQVTAQFSNGDSSLTLYDDGAHNDGSAGDGVYANTWNATGESDNVTVTVSASKTGYTLGQATVSGSVGDVTTYTMKEISSFDWQDISSSGAVLISDGDDVQASLSIGFPFQFFGKQYSSLIVGSNGLMTLSGGTVASSYTNASMPSSASPNAIIAPYWDDLNIRSGTGRVIYRLSGSSPARRLVITWEDVSHYSNYWGLITFQVVLYEADSTIRFLYQDVQFGDGSLDYGLSATVGIEDETGGTASQFSYNRAALKNGLTIEFSPSGGSSPNVPIGKSILGAIRLLMEDE